MPKHTQSHRPHKTEVPYNTQPVGLEKWLDETYTKLPIQLPTEAKKWISDNIWWITAIGGVLMLWGVWSVWQLAHYADGFAKWANEISKAYGDSPVSNDLGVFWWAGLCVMVIEAVVLLLAVSPLKDHKKLGWNLLFYSSLLSLLGSLLTVLVRRQEA